MNAVNRYVPFLAIGLLVSGDAGHAQTACPEDTLWEPYTEVCATGQGRPNRLSATESRSPAAVHSDAPVPGTMSAGTAYAPEQLVALESGRLHTRMFVYPDGLDRDGALPAWLYTTATSRVDDGLEVVGMYAEHLRDRLPRPVRVDLPARLPVPGRRRAPGWQWSRAMPGALVQYFADGRPGRPCAETTLLREPLGSPGQRYAAIVEERRLRVELLRCGLGPCLETRVPPAERRLFHSWRRLRLVGTVDRDLRRRDVPADRRAGLRRLPALSRRELEPARASGDAVP